MASLKHIISFSINKYFREMGEWNRWLFSVFFYFIPIILHKQKIYLKGKQTFQTENIKKETNIGFLAGITMKYDLES